MVDELQSGKSNATKFQEDIKNVNTVFGKDMLSEMNRADGGVNIYI